MEALLMVFAALNGVIAGVVVYDLRYRLREHSTYHNLQKETEEVLVGIRSVHNNLVAQMATLQEAVNKHEVILTGTMRR